MKKIELALKLLGHCPSLGEMRTLVAFALEIHSSNNEDCELRCSTIADLLKINISTAKSGLKMSIDSGLVESYPNPECVRRTLYKLTPAGKVKIVKILS